MRKLLSIILLSILNCSLTEAKFLSKLNGFFELAGGIRFGDDYTKHNNYNLLEKRIQLKYRSFPEFPSFLYDWDAVFDFKAEFLSDFYFGTKTSFSLRELNLTITPVSKLDLKIGRQILSWGTGNYLFINDVFPKDYISFFIGRDDEYLKAPSWAIKGSYFGKLFWMDIVIIPYFEPSIIPKGDRISFYDTLLARRAGRESDWFKMEPSFQFDNTQMAFRFYKEKGSWEWALYFYRGFYTTPQGYKNPSLFQLYYPQLNVYGFSLRGPFYQGIANIEFGYYDAREDRKGNKRLIENPSLKLLLGYSQNFRNELTLGLQYYYEQIIKYSNYRANLLPQDISYDEFHHLITFSINKSFRNETIQLSNFTFFSPSDCDIYLRASVCYKPNDYIKFSLGTNLFWGKDDYTEFGQLEGNSNIYLRLRYSF